MADIRIDLRAGRQRGGAEGFALHRRDDPAVAVRIAVETVEVPARFDEGALLEIVPLGEDVEIRLEFHRPPDRIYEEHAVPGRNPSAPRIAAVEVVVEARIDHHAELLAVFAGELHGALHRSVELLPRVRPGAVRRRMEEPAVVVRQDRPDLRDPEGRFAVGALVDPVDRTGLLFDLREIAFELGRFDPAVPVLEVVDRQAVRFVPARMLSVTPDEKGCPADAVFEELRLGDVRPPEGDLVVDRYGVAEFGRDIERALEKRLRRQVGAVVPERRPEVQIHAFDSGIARGFELPADDAGAAGVVGARQGIAGAVQVSPPGTAGTELFDRGCRIVSAELLLPVPVRPARNGRPVAVRHAGPDMPLPREDRDFHVEFRGRFDGGVSGNAFGILPEMFVAGRRKEREGGRCRRKGQEGSFHGCLSAFRSRMLSRAMNSMSMMNSRDRVRFGCRMISSAVRQIFSLEAITVDRLG